MSLKQLSVLLLCLLTIYGKAQDTVHIKSYTNLVTVRANLDTSIESYIFYDGEDGNEKETIFSTNNKIKTSLSVDYQIISATLSFAPRFIDGNNDNDKKGKSSYTDLKIRFFPKRFIQTVYYKNVKGFYIENMQDLFPQWQEDNDSYIQFPNLRAQSFGGSTSYVF